MTNLKKVKANDLMAFIYYGNIKSVHGEELVVKDVDSGNEFVVRGQSLIERSLSADQFESTKKVSKTEAAEQLINAYNKPVTVEFVKADGNTRHMRCRLVKPEPLLGRSMVEDLDIQGTGSKLRQVDHRTIQSLVVDGVRYVVK